MAPRVHIWRLASGVWLLPIAEGYHGTLSWSVLGSVAAYIMVGWQTDGAVSSAKGGDELCASRSDLWRVAITRTAWSSCSLSTPTAHSR